MDTNVVERPRIDTHVKERAEALTTEMSDPQQAAIRSLGHELHRLNQAVVRCVEFGPLRRAAPHRPPPRRRRLLGRPAGAGGGQAGVSGTTRTLSLLQGRSRLRILPV